MPLLQAEFHDEKATLGEGTRAAADPESGAGKLALHVHCSFSRQRMRLPETTNNWPPVIKTPNFITWAIVPGVESVVLVKPSKRLFDPIPHHSE